VRLTLRVLLGTLLVATLGLSGCATANSGNSITYQRYNYTAGGGAVVSGSIIQVAPARG
jgi:hypothetical protein